MGSFNLYVFYLIEEEAKQINQNKEEDLIKSWKL